MEHIKLCKILPCCLLRKTSNIQPGKVTNKEIEQAILNLHITKRFGCNRIKFRLKWIKEISLSTKTIYNLLKRYALNILEWQVRNKRKWKNFVIEKPNQMVHIDILGPFYIEQKIIPYDNNSLYIFYNLLSRGFC